MGGEGEEEEFSRNGWVVGVNFLRLKWLRGFICRSLSEVQELRG